MGIWMRKIRYKRRKQRYDVWEMRFGVFGELMIEIEFIMNRLWRMEKNDLVMVEILRGEIEIMEII